MERSLVEDAPTQPEQTSTAWATMLKWVWKKKGVVMPTTTVVVETGCTGTGSPTIGLQGNLSKSCLYDFLRSWAFPSMRGWPPTSRSVRNDGVTLMQSESTFSPPWNQWLQGMEVMADAVGTRMRSASQISVRLGLWRRATGHIVSLLAFRAPRSHFKGMV
eukprot:6423690-Amphidinium_carterae.1